jgi:hypothetical protein
VNRIRHNLSTRNVITPQLIGHNLSGVGPVPFQYPFKEAHCSSTITPLLKVDVNDITVLINGTPKISLHPTNSDENFVNEECITKSLMLSFQFVRKFRPELITPQPYCLV